MKTLPLDDLSGALPAYDQSSSDFYLIFVETWNGKACMSPVVFDTKNTEITDPKSWPSRLDLGNLVNCRESEHYQQVKTTY